MRRRSFVGMAAATAAGCVAKQATASQIHMMGSEEAIALEHKTRSIRLRRLVSELGITPEPAFYDYVIPAAIMPVDFHHATPVLRVVFPENSFFDTDKSEILPLAQSMVEAMAEMIEGDVPDVALFVAGHTDIRGGEEHNHNLSVQRARAVASALRASGANGADIWSVGFGQSLPLYPNDSPTHMAYNRRVEFLFGAHIDAVANWLKDQMDVACSGSSGAERLQCLSTLKVRKTYLVEPEARAPTSSQSQPRGRTVTPAERSTTVTPAHRQIVIDLAERSYVVRRPET